MGWPWGRSCSSEQQGTRGACSRGSGGKHVTTLAQWEERKLLGGTHTPAAGPLSQLLQERAVPPEQLRGNAASGERRCKQREKVQVEKEHSMLIPIQLVQHRVDQAHLSVQRKAVVCTAGGGRLRRRLKKNSSLWSTPPSDTTCSEHVGKRSTVTWSGGGRGGGGWGDAVK